MTFFSQKSDSLPFLFLIIVGLFTWALKHKVDRLLERPLIEYTTDIKEVSPGEYKTVIEFSNITLNKRFGNIQLFIVPRQKIHTASWNTDNSMRISNLDRAFVFDSSQNTIALTIEEFQPGQLFSVFYSSVKSVKPSIHYSNVEAVYLENPSFETWLVKHENLIIVCIIGLSFILSIIYAFKIT